MVKTLKENLKFNNLRIFNSETGQVMLTWEGAEYLVADALKNLEQYRDFGVLTVINKRRMPVARAIMQRFKDEGYSPVLDTVSRYKTHEITVPDPTDKWRGARISIISYAVCNPEEQLIEIEVYE